MSSINGMQPVNRLAAGMLGGRLHGKSAHTKRQGATYSAKPKR